MLKYDTFYVQYSACLNADCGGSTLRFKAYECCTKTGVRYTKFGESSDECSWQVNSSLLK